MTANFVLKTYFSGPFGDLCIQKILGKKGHKGKINSALANADWSKQFRNKNNFNDVIEIYRVQNKVIWLPSKKEDVSSYYFKDPLTWPCVVVALGSPFSQQRFGVSQTQSHDEIVASGAWSAGVMSFEVWLYIDMWRKARMVCKLVILWEESAHTTILLKTMRQNKVWVVLWLKIRNLSNLFEVRTGWLASISSQYLNRSVLIVTVCPCNIISQARHRHPECNSDCRSDISPIASDLNASFIPINCT